LLNFKIISEFTDDKNPFQRGPAASSKSNEMTILNTLKMIPKVGEKNAAILLEKFKSKFYFKNLSNFSKDQTFLIYK